MIALGKLLSPFAVEGGIKLKSFSGNITHLKKMAGAKVLLLKEGEQKELIVSNVLLKGEIPVFFFEGYTNPEAVKALGGYELWANRSYAQKLESGEYYVSDLIGCAIVFEGKEIAIVVAYVEASSLLLEAQGADGRSFFIPFIAHFVGDIDIEQKKIELLSDESIML